MKLVIHPAVDETRLAKIREAAGEMAVANCPESEDALREMPEAERVLRQDHAGAAGRVDQVALGAVADGEFGSTTFLTSWWSTRAS